MTNRRKTIKTIVALTAVHVVGPASAQQPIPSKRIRIAQFGTKHAHAIGKLEAIRKFPDTFDFVGVCEPDPSRRAALANHPAFRDVTWLTEEQLLKSEGLQACAVETEVKQLVPTGIKCLQAGLHIHLDKPAGESMSDCKRLHAIANERGLTVQMGYMLRYNPAFQFAKKLMEQGVLGEVTEINAMMGKFMNDGGRKELEQYAGGGMFELACHLIDQVVWMLGPPSNVTSFARRSFPEKDDFADNQLAVLEYPKTLVTIRCNHIDPMGGPRRSFSITGTEGTFEINPLEPTPSGRLGLATAKDGFRKGFQPIEFDTPSGRYDAEFKDLAAVIRGEQILQWDSKHDLATHRAVLQASGLRVPAN
ncbi:Gfo/Idh/MocA family protein [Rhodopirellula sp. MGV]|uniref:Gfo/Idh/MocA family protein n=1 Tax=Rhodopirellula sp. MGV TaxID=2023130 RepID=UPI0013042F3F|nr:Gfo/Idh/MocA family oxidoreductase [Rhodopirellula sp. MGV]